MRWSFSSHELGFWRIASKALHPTINTSGLCKRSKLINVTELAKALTMTVILSSCRPLHDRSRVSIAPIMADSADHPALVREVLPLKSKLLSLMLLVATALAKLELLVYCRYDCWCVLHCQDDKCAPIDSPTAKRIGKAIKYRTPTNICYVEVTTETKMCDCGMSRGGNVPEPLLHHHPSEYHWDLLWGQIILGILSETCQRAYSNDIFR